MSTIANHCYQMVIVATSEDMVSSEPIATESHNIDGWFGDVTEEPL
jgi:hypothetical protein